MASPTSPDSGSCCPRSHWTALPVTAIVDQFLRWANGLPLKVQRLFVPIYFATPKTSRVARALIASAEKINAVRNAVVHQGSFSSTEEAEATIAEAKAFINMIVGLTVEGFDIDAKKTTAANPADNRAADAEANDA